MAKTLSSSPPLITIKEDYIDMDLSPRISSSSLCADFEFKMSSNSLERENNAYPADELFYKGDFFPVQLPPVEEFKERFVIQIQSTPKRNWPKRFDLFKQILSGSKIKASRDYLKSLFTKTNTSVKEGKEEFGAEAISIAQKNTINREKFLEEEVASHSHRKSFSGVIWRRVTGKSSQVSGLSMCSSSDLNRCIEEESSIQGAIAYCKKTQENLVPNRKSIK